jgi:hypothetical protein
VQWHPQGDYVYCDASPATCHVNETQACVSMSNCPSLKPSPGSPFRSLCHIGSCSAMHALHALSCMRGLPMMQRAIYQYRWPQCIFHMPCTPSRCAAERIAKHVKRMGPRPKTLYVPRHCMCCHAAMGCGVHVVQLHRQCRCNKRDLQ